MSRRAPERARSAPERRGEAKAAAKRAIRDELHARGLFPADVAAGAGVSDQEMSRKLDLQSDAKHPTLADLVLLEDGVIEGVLTRLLAGRGMLVVRVPEHPGAGDDPAALVEHHAAAAKAVHEHLHARADGHISPEEGASLRDAALREASIAIKAARLGQLACDERGVSLKRSH